MENGERDNTEDTLDEDTVDGAEETLNVELNSIINYAEATKFVKLDDGERQFWQMFSLKEDKARDLSKDAAGAQKVVSLTQRNLTRVYPGPQRVDSSNYNPIPFWLRGIQMAAMNLQTRDQGERINSAFFQQNGGCGYVLKPDYMVKEFLTYSPITLTDEAEEVITLHLVAGHHLGQGQVTVQVEVEGHPMDQSSWSSPGRPGPHPAWEGAASTVLTVRRPQLAVLKVAVEREGLEPCTSYIALPLLPRGFRNLKLSEVEERASPPPSIDFIVTRS